MDANGGFVIAIVVVLLFLVFREVVCWYWKINEGLELLRQIRDRLPPLNQPTTTGDVGTHPSRAPTRPLSALDEVRKAIWAWKPMIFLVIGLGVFIYLFGIYKNH